MQSLRQGQARHSALLPRVFMQLRQRSQKRAFATATVSDRESDSDCASDERPSIRKDRRTKAGAEKKPRKSAPSKKISKQSVTKASIPILPIVAAAGASSQFPLLNALKERKLNAVLEDAKIVYQYDHLVPGRLIKRYKRFLADVELIEADSSSDDAPAKEANVVTVYCPNTGPMVGLLDLPNARVQLSKSADPKRKYQYTLEMIQVDNGERRVWVGVHSTLANRMVEKAVASQWFPELGVFTSFQREVKFAKNSRVDFVLSAFGDDGVVTHQKYVEVKSVSFAHPISPTKSIPQVQEQEEGASKDVELEAAGTTFCALFPDTISIRAQKHVEELTELIAGKENTSATIVFLVQRDDCHQFSPSFLHDVQFAALCEKASKQGVELLAYSCALEPQEAKQTGHVRLLQALPRYEHTPTDEEGSDKNVEAKERGMPFERIDPLIQPVPSFGWKSSYPKRTGTMAGKAGNTSVLGGASSGEFLSVAGLRVDGRRSEEVRRIRTRFGLFQRVDGSAYYEQGNTKVVAVVYGPRELKMTGAAAASSGVASVGTGSGNAASNTEPRAVVHCEFTQAAFATSERKPQRTGDRKKMESSLAIKQIFEACIQTQLYPRSQIDIFVQVLHADGGELPASINAITLALIDAGIALNDFVVASSAGYLQQTLLCDLNYSEEAARAPQLVIALNPRTQKLNLLQMECKLPLEIFESLMNVAMEGCNQVYDLLQNAVRENTWKRLRSRGTAIA